MPLFKAFRKKSFGGARRPAEPSGRVYYRGTNAIIEVREP